MARFVVAAWACDLVAAPAGLAVNGVSLIFLLAGCLVITAGVRAFCALPPSPGPQPPGKVCGGSRPPAGRESRRTGAFLLGYAPDAVIPRRGAPALRQQHTWDRPRSTSVMPAVSPVWKGRRLGTPVLPRVL